MDLKELEDYIIASRIALTINCAGPINSEDISTLLLKLRQYLSCQGCHKLPDRLNPHFEGFICTECINNHRKIENISISTVKKCFKTLCDFIRTSPLYDILCASDEDRRMVELATEVFSVSHPMNGHNLLNGVSNKQQTEVIDGHYNVDLNSSSNVQLIKNNEKIDCSDISLADMRYLRRKNEVFFNMFSTDKTHKKVGIVIFL